jgi:ArsR family transcriptional regulator
LDKQIHNKKLDQLVSNGIPLDDHAKKIADFFKATGEPTRVRIILALAQTSLSVNEIAEILDMSQSGISHQLKTLRDARIVSGDRLGKEVHYHLIDNHIVNIFEQVIKHSDE